jgi:hypothetical protein
MLLEMSEYMFFFQSVEEDQPVTTSVIKTEKKGTWNCLRNSHKEQHLIVLFYSRTRRPVLQDPGVFQESVKSALLKTKRTRKNSSMTIPTSKIPVKVSMPTLSVAFEVLFYFIFSRMLNNM